MRILPSGSSQGGTFCVPWHFHLSPKGVLRKAVFLGACMAPPSFAIAGPRLRRDEKGRKKRQKLPQKRLKSLKIWQRNPKYNVDARALLIFAQRGCTPCIKSSFFVNRHHAAVPEKTANLTRSFSELKCRSIHNVPKGEREKKKKLTPIGKSPHGGIEKSPKQGLK